MRRPGHAVLILGPSGAGKSALLRSAFEHEGSGVGLLAPGDDELNSYAGLLGKTGYQFKGFDDPEFLPTAGMRTTAGLADALRWATGLRKALAEHYEAAPDGPPKYALLGVDTIDGFAQLAVNIMLQRCGLSEAPPAMSPDGAQYYTGIRNLMNEFFRPIRACRGYGTHLIVTSHVDEKEVAPTSQAGVAGKQYVALIPGAFREQLPAIFDIVLYAGINPAGSLDGNHNKPGSPPRHYVQWVPDPKRPTKSRLGALADSPTLPNEWPILRPLLDAARDRLG